MGNFRVDQRTRDRLQLGRATGGAAVVGSERRDAARKLLREAAADLVSSSGKVRSGYVVFRSQPDSRYAITTSARKGSDAAVEFAKAMRQLVREGWSDKPGVMDALDRYLGGAKINRGVGTQSLVGLVRTLDSLDGQAASGLAHARLSRGALNAERASIERAFSLADKQAQISELVGDATSWNSADPDKTRAFRALVELELKSVGKRLSEQPGEAERTTLLQMSRELKLAVDSLYERELDPQRLLADPSPDEAADAAGLPGVAGDRAAQRGAAASLAASLGARCDGLVQLLDSLQAAEDTLHGEQGEPAPGEARIETGLTLTDRKLNTVRIMRTSVEKQLAGLIPAEVKAIHDSQSRPFDWTLKERPAELRGRHDELSLPIARLELLRGRLGALRGDH